MFDESYVRTTPVFVLLEPKHELGALVDGLAVDAEIRSVFRPEQLLTPDDVQDHWPSLRQAVRDGGWPLLGSTAMSKAFVVNLDIGHYTAGNNDAVAFLRKPFNDELLIETLRAIANASPQPQAAAP